jgi:drug/metabolite transporter (DMT)-like permease
MDSAGRLRWKTRVFALIVILSNALGNFFLTWGMQHRAESLTLSPFSYIQAILSPWVGLGITLLIVWLLSRMALLSWADLSYVLPVTALGYVASAPLGHFFLNEQITPARWVGIVLIFAGTILVGMGHHAGDPL